MKNYILTLLLTACLSTGGSFVFAQKKSKVTQKKALIEAPTPQNFDWRVLVGQYSFDAFKKYPFIVSRLRKLFGKSFTLFEDNFTVVGPFEEIEGAIYSKGCAPRQCGSEEAYLAIDLQTGKISGGILSDSIKDNEIKIFSEAPSSIPYALEEEIESNRSLFPPKALSAGYAEDPFQTDTERLPPNFRGHHAQKIYDALFNRISTIPPKGEFETTAEFNERYSKAFAAPLYGSLTPESTFAFTTNLRVESRYDADNKKLTVNINLNPNFTDYRNNKTDNAYTWSADVKSTSRFINDYLVFETLGTVTSINLSNQNSNQSENNIRVVNIAMDIPTAKKAKLHLRFLITGKLISPWTSYSVKTIFPTVSDNNNYGLVVNYLHFRYNSIWIYNGKTGEIYAKL